MGTGRVPHAGERHDPPRATLPRWASSDRRLTRLSLLAGAWVALALAINLDNGFYSPRALAAVVAAYVILIAGLLVPFDPSRESSAGRLVRATGRLVDALRRRQGVLVGLGLGLALLGGLAAVLAEVRGDDNWVARLSLVAAAGIAVAALGRSRPGPGWWLVMFAFVTVAYAITIVDHTPSDNDVWYSVTGGSATFTQGLDLYQRCWPGNTDPLTDCVYAYLPLTSVLVAPGLWVLGDIRYTYIVAMAVASLSISRIAPPRFGVLFGFVMAAAGFLLVQRAWTEVLLMAGVAAAVWAAVRHRSAWIVAAMAIVFGTKQHMVLLLPLTVAWRSMGLRRTVLAFGIAALLALPWFLADPSAFIDDTVRFHMGLAPRSDSLSLFVLATRGGFGAVLQPVAPLLIIIPTVLAEAVAVWRLPRTTLGFTLGGSLVLFTFALFNKQSFYNHYTLVLAFILVAIALLLRADDDDLVPAPPSAA
jgi:hypothetical protein